MFLEIPSITRNNSYRMRHRAKKTRNTPRSLQLCITYTYLQNCITEMPNRCMSVVQITYKEKKKCFIFENLSESESLLNRKIMARCNFLKKFLFSKDNFSSAATQKKACDQNRNDDWKFFLQCKRPHRRPMAEIRIKKTGKH